MPTLDSAIDGARDLLASLWNESRSKRPLWPAPYDKLTPEAAYRFLTECWWTYNEADGGAIELVPKEEFVRVFCEEWVTCYTTRTPMLTEKSRRLVVSWMSRGLETWVCGLSRLDWLIIDQTYAGSGEHLWRIHFSLEQLRDNRPEFRLPNHQYRGALITKELTHVVLPNGSSIMATYQRAESQQGKGKSGITLEELSKYMAPAEFWAQAQIVTMGKVLEDGSPSGGWVNGIANSSPSPEWHAIKDLGHNADGKPLHMRAIDLLKVASARLMHGMAAAFLPGGTRYVVLHYTADSGKREPKWALAARKGVPDRQWNREMELREDQYEGLPVFEMYRDELHCPSRFLGVERIAPVAGSTFICGIDGGNTLRPAAILIEITPFPSQVRVLLEITSKGNEDMSIFAPRVLQAIQRRIPLQWPEVQYVGDGTINNRMGGNGRSAGDYAKDVLGVKPKAMSNVPQVRQAAVNDLLTGQVAGPSGSVYPLFVMDGGACPMLREGFLGAYRLGDVQRSDGTKGFTPEPLKNEFADPHDGLQYAAQAARKILVGSGGHHRKR